MWIVYYAYGYDVFITGVCKHVSVGVSNDNVSVISASVSDQCICDQCWCDQCWCDQCWCDQCWCVLFLQHRVLPQPARAKYVATSDELIVEDTVSRVVLTGSIAKDELVTGDRWRGDENGIEYDIVLSLFEGIIIGIFGEETNNGLFEVKDHCFADLSFPALASVPKGLNEDK